MPSRFRDLLQRCAGEQVFINGNLSRSVVAVEEDFLILEGGNPQMRVTEFVPLHQIVRLIRMEYAGGETSFAFDIISCGSDHSNDSH